MGRKFDIPAFYRSPIISTIKQARRLQDQRKKDLTPSILDLGSVQFKIARHFGFCYGVENAIEIAFRAISENPGKRIFLLSEMIHNPSVNNDLKERGVQFLQSTDGKQLTSFQTLTPEDIVIVPAFGTTVELFEELRSRGINPQTYNATCPFVEKVWNRSEQLGKLGFTIVIHGKHYHEETRATFSHARQSAPSVVIRDMKEAELLAEFIRCKDTPDRFYEKFAGKFSPGFNPITDLKRVGVVNQTTMLAGQTQDIADFLRNVMLEQYGEDKIKTHFADTKDTLCYATTENQQAIQHLVQTGGDIAIIIGGYNSSNTAHLAKICSHKLATYYIQDAGELLSHKEIRHLDLESMQIVTTRDWLPVVSRDEEQKVSVLISAGASSPDALVDEVIMRIAELYEVCASLKPALIPYEELVTLEAV